MAHPITVLQLISEVANYAETGQTYDSGGCYDAETRVLTRKGFKFFRDLSDDDELAGLNERGELVYEKAIARTQYTHVGEMVHFRGRSTDLLVTPNHRIYWRPSGKANHAQRAGRAFPFSISRADELTSYHDGYCEFKKDAKWVTEQPDPENFVVPSTNPTTVAYEDALTSRDTHAAAAKRHGVHRFTVSRWRRGSNRPTETTNPHVFKILDWAEFMGWFLSEGSLAPKAGRVVISQSKSNGRAAIRSLLRRMGIRFYEHPDGISFYNKRLTTYLTQFGKAPDKHIPDDLKNLSLPILRVLLAALIQGDGSVHGRGYSYSSVSKRLAEDVLELALKCGYATTISSLEPKPGRITGRLRIHQVRFNPTETTPRVSKISVRPFSGLVFCAQVPSGLLFVERNGKTCWSGNSYLCGACALRRGTDACLYVEGPISFTTGSCALWISVAPWGLKYEPGEKLSQTDAGYAERPKARGFGCVRCEYAKPNDSDTKRSLDCSQWKTAVLPTACCREHDGPDMINAPGERK